MEETTPQQEALQIGFKQRVTWKEIFIAVVVVIGGLSIIGSYKMPAMPEVRITAAKLSDEYRANEITANLRYQGKYIRIEGIVGAKGKSTDGIFVRMDDGQIFTGVQCFFPDSEAKRVAGLNSNAKIGMIGKV